MLTTRECQWKLNPGRCGGRDWHTVFVEGKGWHGHNINCLQSDTLFQCSSYQKLRKKISWVNTFTPFFWKARDGEKLDQFWDKQKCCSLRNTVFLGTMRVLFLFICLFFFHIPDLSFLSLSLLSPPSPSRHPPILYFSLAKDKSNEAFFFFAKLKQAF